MVNTAWLQKTQQALTYIAYPLAIVARVIFWVLYLLATPFIYIAVTSLRFLAIPWRIFASFEALWYFLAAAVVLGIICGLIIHLFLRLSTIAFKLDQKTPPKDIPAKGHDVASYRTAREEKRRKEEGEKRRKIETRARLLASQPLIQEVVREARRKPISGPTTVPISPNTATVATRSGLFTQTILEHSDEESESAF